MAEFQIFPTQSNNQISLFTKRTKIIGVKAQVLRPLVAAEIFFFQIIFSKQFF